MEKNADARTIHIVVYTIAIISIFGVFGEFVLTWYGKDIPDAIVAGVSGAVGSLATLLTTTRGGRGEDSAKPMEVVTPPGKPLDVTPVDENDLKDEQANLQRNHHGE